MRRTAMPLFAALILTGVTTNALAQAAPKLLQVNWESVKAGRDAAHERNEKGWPAAYAAAGGKSNYIALTGMTGTAEALYVSGWASYAQFAENQKTVAANPALTAQLAKLWEKDAEFLNNARSFFAEQVDSIGIGTAPEWSKVRGYRITMVRVKMGRAADYEKLRRMQRAAADRAGIDMHLGIYRVTSGVAVPTFMIFRPFNSLADLDSWPAMQEKAAAAATAEERAEFARLGEAAITSSESNIYNISAAQSYPSVALVQAAPDFWKGNPVLAMAQKASGVVQAGKPTEAKKKP